MEHVWLKEERPDMPKITDSRLSWMAFRFRPLFKNGPVYMTMKLPDLRGTAFTWEPKPDGYWQGRFEPIHDIETIHSCGYYGMLKPSIAEVMACVPDDLPSRCNAFALKSDQTIGIYSCGTGHRAYFTFGRMVT